MAQAQCLERAALPHAPSPPTQVTRKVAPALAAGCTVVLKPSEETPFSALALAELGRRAGLPAGALNVVTCGRDEVAAVGAALCAAPEIRALSFTGSTAVGMLLARDCAATVKKVGLELGGNAPFVVFGDADLDLAVRALMAAKFRASGQTCICADRVLVHASVYGDFSERLLAAVAELKGGHGAAEGTTQGPLINGGGVAKARVHIDDAVAKGATVLAGGSDDGRHVEPTVLGGCDAGMLAWDAENFAPVLCLRPFETDAEALALANAGHAGLCAYFCTSDIGRTFRFAEGLEYGMVGVNEGIISDPVAPFGGVKHSGLGREGGTDGMDEYLETKYVCIGGVAAR